MYNKKEQWIIFLVCNALLVVAIALFPVYRAFAHAFPMPCGMVEHLNLYCPACGGTRALEAFLSFDLGRSLICNPIVVLGTLCILTAEIDMIRYLAKKGARPSVIRMPLVFFALGIWLVFFLTRNVLLFCGVDLLGDILA